MSPPPFPLSYKQKEKTRMYPTFATVLEISSGKYPSLSPASPPPVGPRDTVRSDFCPMLQGLPFFQVPKYAPHFLVRHGVTVVSPPWCANDRRTTRLLPPPFSLPLPHQQDLSLPPFYEQPTPGNPGFYYDIPLKFPIPLPSFTFFQYFLQWFLTSGFRICTRSQVLL